MVSAKICGLKDSEILHAAVTAGADYIGFVMFPPSPRHITLEQAEILLATSEKGTAKTVVVLVNPEDVFLESIANRVKPDFIQLHGKETPFRVQEIRSNFDFGIIKAIPVATPEDVTVYKEYEAWVDHIMFDAKPKPDDKLPGGNARSFDWSLVKGLKLDKPWFLSGGLTPANVKEAVAISGAPMVDVSSGVESAPGQKDSTLIKQFLANVKSIHA